MSDLEGKPKVSNFKKRDHRPWNTSLLESTVQKADETSTSDSLDLPDFNLSLDANTLETSDYSFSDLNFVQEQPPLSESLNDTFSQLAAIANQDSSNFELKSAIKQSEQTKGQLLQKINDKSSSSILLGGFFQPQQLNSSEETQSKRKMNFLLSDLKNKEQELNSLTNNLKVSEAIERSEQAELNRRAEEQRRLAAENRMRQAIEQAQIAAEQCRLAMEQANEAAVAYREEEQLRRIAEDQINDLKVRLNNTELSLHHERNAKVAAEQTAKNALQQTESATQLAMQQSQDTLDKASQLGSQNEQLQRKITEVENKHNDAASSLIYTQQKVTELTAQRDKLKSIIEAEQDLRRVAEKRAQEALARAETAETARQAEEQHRIMTDERAKRAVEHANRTVMHLLNAPVDNEYNVRTPQDATKEKLKIKVTADTNVSDYQTIADDYTF